MKKRLIAMVSGKKVQICGHWDADGVSSAAMLYHFLKPHCVSIKTLTKGNPFFIAKEDIEPSAEVIVCTDIIPSTEILNLPQKPKVIYIDHHPNPDSSKFDVSIHDPLMQSTTLLIYDVLFKDTSDPYIIFLTLMGYFGDGGNRHDIPWELEQAATNLMPELMQRRQSAYDDDFYLDIERFVPALNTGKRLHWSGEVPLELLKSIECYKPFVSNLHPLAMQLQHYREMLREAYDQQIDVKKLSKVDYAVIEDPRNIQGVIAARYMEAKPILVMNRHKGEIIGSMRVPDELDLDAGKFLEPFNSAIGSFLGGGHEKAAGFTMAEKDLDAFLGLLKKD